MNRLLLVLALAATGCPTPEELKPSTDAGHRKVDVVTEASPAAPKAEMAQRPAFGPEKAAPCDSHTACYLQAKEAHATGERAGYLLALEKCEFYRGRYQLEKFYGLCLLILADAYRHLDNFTESQNCYQRFLDAQPDDQELALQAREGIEEVRTGLKEPLLYKRYLQAVSMLRRFNSVPNEDLVKQAEEVLSKLQAEHPEWALKKKVKFLLEQIEGMMEAGEDS